MATVQEIIDQLQQQFEIDDKTRAWLTDSDAGLGAKTVDDFVFSVSSEQEVANLIEAAKPDNKFLAVARLRKMW